MDGQRSWQLESHQERQPDRQAGSLRSACLLCKIFVEAPDPRTIVSLNFTSAFGLGTPSESTAPSDNAPRAQTRTWFSSTSRRKLSASTRPQPLCDLGLGKLGTDGLGKENGKRRHKHDACTSGVEIVEVTTSGRERALGALCYVQSRAHEETLPPPTPPPLTPRQFRSHTHLLKLTFYWPRDAPRIGYTVNVSFLQQQGQYIHISVIGHVQATLAQQRCFAATIKTVVQLSSDRRTKGCHQRNSLFNIMCKRRRGGWCGWRVDDASVCWSFEAELIAFLASRCLCCGCHSKISCQLIT